MSQALEDVATPTAIVLSPHSDDASFSLAGTLRTLVDAGTSVRIVTPFSRSAYARKDGGDPKLVTKIRQEEDQAFKVLLGPACACEWMGLHEANLRGVPLNMVLTERRLTVDEQRLRDRIASAVQSLLTANATVYLPLGLGSHVDHRIVRDAGVAASTSAGTPLRFYEDLPYAAMYSLDSLDAIIHTFAASLHTTLEAQYVSFRELIPFKTAAARCYPSQLSAEWLDAIVYHAGVFDGTHGAERLWRIA